VCDGLQKQGAQLSIPLVTSGCDFEAGLARYTRWLRRIPKGAMVMDAASKRLFHREVRRNSYDCILVTSPAFDASFLRQNAEAPFVMVVHDLMTCVTAPDGLYDAAGPGLAGLLYLARRASLVVCISHDTREALLKHNAIPPERVCVIPTGNLLAAADPAETMVATPDRFLLFVGERSGRKGFFTLVRALQTIFQEHPDLHLICTGRFSITEQDYLHWHGIADRVQAIPADDGVLVGLYRRAVCLIYPSLYEGFGLPVIEAMHYRCPVITTHMGALAEIAGTAAMCVDPFDVEEIQQAIRTMLNSPQQRSDYVARGVAHSAQFQTAEMMSRFYGVMEEVFGARAASSRLVR
jgi:glycosyltransferase involved in cell wall biosynthesis